MLSADVELRRIVDGEYADESFGDGVQRIFDLAWRSKDKPLVEKYGLWMLKHDQSRALRVCALVLRARDGADVLSCSFSRTRSRPSLSTRATYSLR